MTRVRPAAAFLAATIAFGSGYAVRLACAWAGGTSRVVAPDEDESASRETAARRRVHFEAPTIPRPPEDAATSSAEAPRADATPSSAADVARRELCDVFTRHGRTLEFRRMIDKVAVAPLGRAPEDLGLLDARASAPAPLTESAADLRVRVSAVNAAAGRRPPTQLQFAAFRRGGRFEVALGDAGLPTTFDPPTMAGFFAARAAKAMPGASHAGNRGAELAPDAAAALLRWCEEAHRAREAARQGMWSLLHDLAASGEARPLDPRDVAGVCVAGGRCVVVRVGDDPELDRLLDEADRDERAVRAEVEAMLRR